MRRRARPLSGKSKFSLSEIVLSLYDSRKYSRTKSANSHGHQLTSVTRGFLLEGALSASQVDQLVRDLLVDPVVETGSVRVVGSTPKNRDASFATVMPKPGVMDPAALSVVDAARDLGVTLRSVRTFRRYYFSQQLDSLDAGTQKALANDAIEQIALGALTVDHLTVDTRGTRFP